MSRKKWMEDEPPGALFDMVLKRPRRGRAPIQQLTRTVMSQSAGNTSNVQNIQQSNVETSSIDVDMNTEPFNMQDDYFNVLITPQDRLERPKNVCYILSKQCIQLITCSLPMTICYNGFRDERSSLVIFSVGKHQEQI